VRGLCSDSLRQTTLCRNCISKSPIVCHAPSTHMVRSRKRTLIDKKAHGHSCPCTISRGAKESCSAPQGAMEGRQEGEPCCCCRGGSQGSCKGDLGVADGCCFFVARYLYHASEVAIKNHWKKNEMKRLSHGSPRGVVGERGPCVRN